MNKSLAKIIKIFVLLLLGLAALLYAGGLFIKSGLESDQPQMFSDPVYDTRPPLLPEAIAIKNERQPSVLVFSKTNGFRHKQAIAAASDMFSQLADAQDWLLFQTENAAVFAPELLSQFDVVVWSNATGPALTETQQQAFKHFILGGGGFVAIHAAGDASHASWPWYQDHVIRAKFTGHALLPQFQLGTVTTELKTHPAMRHLPEQWQHMDEWYCFENSPRDDVDVLASLSENDLNFWSIDHRNGIKLRNLAMGDDHPVIWSQQLGLGRVFYSALGHTAESYTEQNFVRMISQAIVWAAQS